MHKLLAKITVWATDKKGATAIEYGLIAAGVSIAISIVVFTLGDQLEALFESVADKLGGAAGG